MPVKIGLFLIVLGLGLVTRPLLSADSHAFVADTSNASTLSFFDHASGLQTAGLALGAQTNYPATYAAGKAFVVQSSLTAGNTIAAYSLSTGKPAGSATLPVEVIVASAASPAAHKLYLLAALTAPQFAIYELDTDTFTYQQVFSSSVSLQALAISPDGNTIYAATANSVLLIATSTFQQIGTILIAGIFRITPSPDGKRVYLSGPNGVASQVIAWDLQSGAAVGTVPADSGAWVAVSPDSSTLYTTLITSHNNTGAFQVEQVSAATMTIGKTLALGSSNSDGEGPPLAISPDGTTLAVLGATGPGPGLTEITLPSFVQTTATPTGNSCGVAFLGKSQISVTNCGANAIQVVDVTAQTVLAQLDAGPSPQYTLLGLNGKILYVSNPYGVWALAPRSGKVLSKIQFPVKAASAQLALSANGKTLFASYGSGVAEISTTTNRLVGPVAGIPSGFSVGALATSSNNHYLFVGGTANDSFNDYQLLVLDQASGSLISSNSAQSLAVSLTASSDGSVVYFQGLYEGAFFGVSAFSFATGTFAPVNVQPNGGGMVLSPDGKTLYVPDNLATVIEAYDTTTQTVTTLASPVDPMNLAITPDGSQLVITSRFDYLGLINVASPSVGEEIPLNAATSGVSVY